MAYDDDFNHCDYSDVLVRAWNQQTNEGTYDVRRHRVIAYPTKVLMR